MAIKFPGLTSERIALLKHPLNLTKLHLKFARNELYFLTMDLASGNRRNACRHLQGARTRLRDCDEIIVANAKITPDNFLRYFYKERAAIEKEISDWSLGGIAKGMQSYRQCIQMVFTI